MKILAMLFFVCLAVLSTGAVTLETGRIKVVTGGEHPTLKYDQNPAFSFEVRAWGKDGWWVRSSAVRGVCYIFSAEVGEQVLDAPFDTYQWTSHDSGPNVSVFRFQFRWMHTFGTESGGTATLMHYGWVSLVTNDAGEVCALASQVADVHGLAVVGQGEPDPPVAPEDPVAVAWSYHVVKDSWVELDSHCIPETTAGTIQIPSEIEGKAVKVISHAAFKDCDRVTSILIPDTVEQIESRAFSGCNALTSLTIPSSVTNVGAQIVCDATNLTQLTIRHNAAAVYQDQAFAGTYAKDITLEEGIARIGNRMFLSSRNLEKITVPKSVEQIEDESFANCPKLKTAYVFVGTTVARGAFPAHCQIVRYGPTISSYNGARLRSAEKATLIRMLGKPDEEDIHIQPDWDFREQDGGETPVQPDDAAILCVKLGISPIEVSNKDGRVSAKFRIPSVNIVSFDPGAGKVTGKVIPAAGTRIAEPPMPYVFGLNYWEYFGQADQYVKELGWECAAQNTDIKLDLSRYMETGEFTFAYPLWYPLDDCPAIFSVDIGDYNPNSD